MNRWQDTFSPTADQATTNLSKFSSPEKNCPKNASNTATMETVGEFNMNYDNNSDIQVTFALTGTKIVWPKGSPPKDSPECGFDNEKCLPKSTDAESGKTLSKLLLFSCIILARDQLGWRRLKLVQCSLINKAEALQFQPRKHDCPPCAFPCL